jgi:2,3-bisphosphoglycerate-independent phosphoglycerate mutase
MKKTALIILDGLGLAPSDFGNAITRQTMPNFHRLMDTFGYASLAASGPEVGLAEGQAGNSEVGHITIGAGRIIGTTLTRIQNGFASGAWERNAVWGPLRGRPRIHIAGLLSDAGVHSHYSNMIQSAVLATRAGASEVCLHVFLDGVDSPKGSAVEFIKTLLSACQPYPEIRLSSVSGRRWSCDRSGSAEITAHCVDGLTRRGQAPAFSLERLIAHLSTGEGEATFPFHYGENGHAIDAGEPVILTHHRADRTRQLASALGRHAQVYSLVELEGSVPLNRVFFPVESIKGGLVDTLRQYGVSLSRAAETCKFPHVTFFMNGMREENDKAIEVPSIPEARIPMQPEMSLAELTRVTCALLEDPRELALVANIPNLDQVGHTGDLETAKQAAAYVDQAVQVLFDQSQAHGWKLIFTADHGNADAMLDESAKPLGSHSRNPVPLVVVDPTGKAKRLNRSTATIANVAPTFLASCGIEPPPHMESALIDL